MILGLTLIDLGTPGVVPCLRSISIGKYSMLVIVNHKWVNDSFLT